MKKGFTLIELLVVIAIIGILSGIVLTSLNQARGKAADASVKANLAGMRAQAEIVYDNASPNSYDGVCEDTTITNALTAANNAGGSAGACIDSSDAAATNDGWAVSAPLKTGGYWCVDYTGIAATSSGNVADDTCS